MSVILKCLCGENIQFKFKQTYKNKEICKSFSTNLVGEAVMA